ncbi:hypothetical protein H7347_07155 [Corynebacterium sp. zg-331]|uniref:hypothetical protein n=1 Tax=unclassified Corynebacterium TaxID=2624378 RepID=UPI00128DA83D|nr:MULTISPECIES: hypothetical protein [unclassified Corynebacterium]MBC3186350.1 hypothetical protein [Corynebacterium sp. zg-331]MPV52837.1 hypothetical protein [Corynebacterium sp. zg331]
MTTWTDLITRIATTNDLDYDVAENLTQAYADQLHDLDGTTIDEDNIDDDTAGFLAGCVATSQEDRTVVPLQRVEEHAEEYRAAAQTAQDYRSELEKAIRHARAEGATYAQLIAASGLSTSQIQKAVQAGNAQ